jgi:hypothetical protein
MESVDKPPHSQQEPPFLFLVPPLTTTTTMMGVSEEGTKAMDDATSTGPSTTATTDRV